MKRAATAFLLAASLASADDVDDRLRTAQALLESDDAASRDKGEAALAAVAAAAGSRLKRLLEHPDAEVRARVATVLDREQVIPEDGKTARLREIFEALGKPGAADASRRNLLRDLLSLHPRAVGFVARELQEGRLSGTPDDSRVVPPGRVAVDFEVKNDGECGAWIRPSRWYTFPSLKPFGERPGHASATTGAAGGLVSLQLKDETAADSMLRALSEMVRVPKGGSAVLVTSSSEQPRCGSLQVRAQAMGYSPDTLEASFSGETLRLPESTTAGGLSVTRTVVGELPGKRFKAQVYAFGQDLGLELTAREEVAAMKIADFDPFWWVALDDRGRFLAEGAFGTEEADLAAWKKDEVRRVKLRNWPPAGTKTLWMGFSGAGDECVPSPAHMR